MWNEWDREKIFGSKIYITRTIVMSNLHLIREKPLCWQRQCAKSYIKSIRFKGNTSVVPMTRIIRCLLKRLSNQLSSVEKDLLISKTNPMNTRLNNRWARNRTRTNF